MERIACIAAMTDRVRQRPEQVKKFGDRAGIAMGDDQRNSIGLGRADMVEMNMLAINLGLELRIGIEARFGRPPVKFVAPIFAKPLQET